MHQPPPSSAPPLLAHYSGNTSTSSDQKRAHGHHHAPVPGPGQPLLGAVLPVSDRRRLWHLMRGVEMPRGVAHPDSQRLKATWIVRLAANGVPLQEIMTAAGYRTFRTFNNVAPYLPRRPPEVVAQALAGR